MTSYKRALISVSDKDGLLEFAQGLLKIGIELIATEGTVKYLGEHGIVAGKISEYTGQKEILGGRVKTLHPKIFASILATDRQTGELTSLGLDRIDMVVVNLYPFEATISHQSTTYEEAMENVDIGGVTLIRAAAKNAKHVAIITNKVQYPAILEELKSRNGSLSQETLQKLAIAAFKRTADYDTAVYNYLLSK